MERTPEQQAKRVDRLVRQHSGGRFRNLRHMVTTPDYSPSLRASDPQLTEIADAYDQAQIERGCPRRACR